MESRDEDGFLDVHSRDPSLYGLVAGDGQKIQQLLCPANVLMVFLHFLPMNLHIKYVVRLSECQDWAAKLFGYSNILDEVAKDEVAWKLWAFPANYVTDKPSFKRIFLV